MMKYFIETIENIEINKNVIINETINDPNKKIITLKAYSFLFKQLDFLQIKYQSFKIIKNEFGKPLIENTNINFSISHKNNIIVVVIGLSELGIDIEELKVRSPKLINRISNENELETIIILGEYGAIKLFSAKEAYLKSTGIGMRLNMSKLTLSHNNGFIIDEKKVLFFEYQNNNKKYVISIAM